MENKGTVWIRGKFIEISVAILGILGILVAIGVTLRGDVMIAITYCASTDSYCILFRWGTGLVLMPIIAYFIILLVVFSFETTIKLARQAYLNFVHWLTKPDSNKLILGLGSVYGNEHTLKFNNKEWRYLLRYMFVLAVVKYDHGREAGALKWRQPKRANILILRGLERRSNCELNFIKVDADNNVFWVDSNDKYHLDQHKFPRGIYLFSIELNYAFASKPIFDHDFPFLKSHIVYVNYGGGNEISIEVKDIKHKRLFAEQVKKDYSLDECEDEVVKIGIEHDGLILKEDNDKSGTVKAAQIAAGLAKEFKLSVIVKNKKRHNRPLA